MSAKQIFLTHNCTSENYALLLLSAQVSGVLGTLVPEIVPSYDFEQHNPMHSYTVWMHSIEAIRNVDKSVQFLAHHGVIVNPQDYIPTLRVALFFHDIGKPATFELKDGKGTFYAHAAEGEKITRSVINRLGLFDQALKDKLCLLVDRHMTLLSLFTAKDKSVKKFVNSVGVDLIPYFIGLTFCDIMGGAPTKINENLTLLVDLIGRIKICNIVFEDPKLKLAITGHDLMPLGIKGRELGECLTYLEQQVVSGALANTRNDLLTCVARIKGITL
jgi:tRNA nucleotidyltransferase (CCA-adding enzyme)